MTRTDDVQVDAEHRLGRLQSRKVEKWRATQRLAGSYILGGVAAWKLLTYPDGGSDWILGMWVAVALLAFGLASFDQVLKALKR
ncbi:hypothetical protein LCGC14_2150460 [marine sediment metagenome]|uniref:Uncharacterized protein n=1 Tax=marine sediment metagenome TaxID=412755 RepID=A0A0F9GS25_9ZZZZ